MTIRGIGFVLLFALLLLSAFATGFSEIFLMAIIAGLVVTFALASAIAGVFVLRPQHFHTPQTAVRNYKVQIAITFKGIALLPVIVRLSIYLPEGQTYTIANILWGSHHITAKKDIVCHHRGIWQTSITRVSFSDIFGFFSLPLPHSKISKPVEPLVIYPILYELTGSPIPTQSSEYSENITMTHNQGDSFTDTRLYQSGDSLKRIHWKLSARTQQLYTRQYETPIDRLAVIILDTRTFSDELSQTWNYDDMATECAAALALLYLNNRHGVRIYSSKTSDDGILVRTKDEFDTAYTLLARAPFDAVNSPVERILSLTNTIQYISALYVITPKPSPELIEAITPLCSSRRYTSIIYKNYVSSEQVITPDGLNLIPISQPSDILERLGDAYE